MPEILPGVHVVSLGQATGVPGGAMNGCLLVEGGQITAVDAGLPGDSTTILDYVAGLGLMPQAVKRVIVTHHHLDHVGGLPELVDRTGAEVWAHRDDAATIEGELPRPAIPAERIESMLAAVPAAQRDAAAARWKQLSEAPSSRVDLRLVGDEELNVLGGVRILHSPGHTPGHLCLYLPALSLLIAGDLLRLTDGVIRESPSGFAADADQSLASARRIAQLGFHRFIGYHGGFVVDEAQRLLSDSLASS